MENLKRNMLLGITSDINNMLVTNYIEFIAEFFNMLQEFANENIENTHVFIDSWVNELKLGIAENNCTLRQLEIYEKNKPVEKGFISIHTIQKNNLLTLNEKYEVFIDHLKFFKSNVSKSKNSNKKDHSKYAEKWYGYAYAILVNLGKHPLPIKDELGKYDKINLIFKGNDLYGTGEGFYKGYLEIDLTKMNDFVLSINSAKDRNNWKNIIIDITENDADVINWLKKRPN